LFYQWLFNGTTMTGATSNPLVLSNVGSAQAGSYQVVVTNSAGTVSSATANLTVLSPPSIVTDVANQTVSIGSNVMFQVGVGGSAPFGYQWLFNGANLAGGTNNPLVLPNVDSAQAGTYQVKVTNLVGAASSSVASLTVMIPPSITTDLTNQTAGSGSTVIFTVGVTGNAPLAYQWLFNGTTMIGATTNPLVLPNVASAQAGTYQVQVSNVVGAITSSVASLTILVPPQITGATFDGTDFVVSFSSILGQNYELQSTKDQGLSSWFPLVTNLTGNGGILQVKDTNAPSARQMLYRVRTGF
jgi:hypothetical protein